MAFELWDVVGALFPNQEDKSKSTPRPAIVLEDLQSEVLLCPLTTQLHQASKYKYTIEVKQKSAEGIAMNLTGDSIIVLDRQEIIRKHRLTGPYGVCPGTLCDKIEEMISKMKKDGYKP
jgi:hypothetical protein